MLRQLLHNLLDCVGLLSDTTMLLLLLPLRMAKDRARDFLLDEAASGQSHLEPKPPPCVRPGCRLPSKPKQRAKREEDLDQRGKERKGRLGQTQEVGGSCAAFNPLGTRGAGKVKLNRQSSQ